MSQVIASSARLDWILKEPGVGAVLTVAGPKGVERREFRAGSAVAFTTAADDGSRRPDGTYVWELTVVRAPARAPAPVLTEGPVTSDGRPVDARPGPIPAGIASSASGSFWILNGAVVAGDAPEPASRRAPAGSGRPGGSGRASLGPISPLDQVIADDLIVQGSECVGLDCVNNEVFGFDTIRLKENNDRIQFDDTSTSAGFPTRNWQIRANSSASGGQEFLAFVDQGATGNSETGTILFQVTAGAPANSLFVASTGKVGFRTTTPVLDLHVKTGDTPALRFEQDASSGFTAQTWDVAGNEANFFVRDVTGGSRLPLRIRPGAPTSSLDIAASGNVGIGTASPQGNLDIHTGSATNDVLCGLGVDLVAGPAFNFGYAGASIARGVGFFNVRPDASAVAPNPSIRFLTVNVERMIITNSGNVGIGTSNPANPLQMASGAFVSAGGVWTSVSTRAAKDDIRELTAQEALEMVRDLSPVKYVYKAAPGEHHIGFIAEDVPAPLASEDRKGMSPMDVAAVLTKVIQEQGRTLAEQSRALEELRARLEKLEGRPSSR